jgi:hypothetical protein
VAEGGVAEAFAENGLRLLASSLAVTAYTYAVPPVTPVST